MIFNSLLVHRNPVLQFRAAQPAPREVQRKLHAATDTKMATEPERERSRRVSRETRRALQTLSHAINYLTADFAQPGAVPILNPLDPKIHAVRILMAVNLEVYFSCPLSEPWVFRTWRLLFGSGKPGDGTLAMHDSRH